MSDAQACFQILGYLPGQGLKKYVKVNHFAQTDRARLGGFADLAAWESWTCCGEGSSLSCQTMIDLLLDDGLARTKVIG